MSDDKSKTGKPDRDRISGGQRYEVDHLARKTEMPAALVKKIIEQVGPSRLRVEQKLNEMKRNGRK